MSNDNEKTKTAPASKSGDEAKRNVRVSITKTKTRANGFIFGKGAVTLVTADQAKALVEQGRATVIGV